MTPQLPVIDLSDFTEGPQHRSATTAAVAQSLMQNGFMYVLGHGIDGSLMERAFTSARGFFARPRKYKSRYRCSDAGANFGYQGIETQRLDPGGAPDLKECFTMGNALRHADEIARWPGGDFRDTALDLYTVGLRAGYRIMEILATSLALPADFFALRHRGENVTLRFLRYPAGAPMRPNAQLGAGAHTDVGSITLLFQEAVGGLELLGADGKWQSAPPVPGAAVVNTGDLMERWTNGRFRSAVHRVRPITGKQDRYSIGLFVDPDAAVEVECLASCVSLQRPARFPRITAGEHMRQRVDTFHKART